MKYFIALGIGAFCLFSCNERRCVNTNPVFDQFGPQKEEYKAELAKELSKGAGVDFSIDSYKAGVTMDTLYVRISGDTFCAVGIAQVDKSNEKLAGVRENKAKGYVGAGLLGAQFKVVGNDLILEDVMAIVD